MFVVLSVVLVVAVIGIVVVLWASLERLESAGGLGVDAEEETAREEEERESPPAEEPEEQIPLVVTAEEEKLPEPEQPEAVAPVSESDVVDEVEAVADETVDEPAQVAPPEPELTEREPDEIVSVEPEVVEEEPEPAEEEPAEIAPSEPEFTERESDEVVLTESEVVEEEPIPPEKESLEHLLPDLDESEFKELPVEGEENFLLPRWMYQFFSRGESCYALGEDGSVALFVKASEAKVILEGEADFQLRSATTSSEVVLTIRFEDGSATATTEFTFDLSDDVGLWSAIKFVDQINVRLDILSRDEEGRLEYTGTRRLSLSPQVESDLRAIIKELSGREQ